MTADEIRAELLDNMRSVGAPDPTYVSLLLYSAQMEIAAQLAEMNQRQSRAAENARDASLEQDLARGGA